MVEQVPAHLEIGDVGDLHVGVGRGVTLPTVGREGQHLKISSVKLCLHFFQDIPIKVLI